jgi:hypothetical protein
MAESATFALKAGVWFRRGRLLIVSPESLGAACPLSGRNSTYRPVQISAAGSVFLLVILSIPSNGGIAAIKLQTTVSFCCLPIQQDETTPRVRRPNL